MLSGCGYSFEYSIAMYRVHEASSVRFSFNSSETEEEQ